MDNNVQQQKKTNALCIAGLVCAFVVPLLGLILSIVGVSQANKNNEEGKILGIFGIIFGGIGTLVSIIAIFIWIYMFGFVVSEITESGLDANSVIEYSKNEISRAKANSYLDTACSNLVKGEYSSSESDEFTLECEDYVCVLKTGDKTYTRTCNRIED